MCPFSKLANKYCISPPPPVKINIYCRMKGRPFSWANKHLKYVLYTNTQR